MEPTTPAGLKEAARHRFRAERQAMSDAARSRSSTGLQKQVIDWLAHRPGPANGALVAAYLSMDPEPGTLDLLETLTRTGMDVVVPICEPAYQLSWCRWHTGVELRRSPRAPLLEPVGQRFHYAELLARHGRFALVLVPGLAVDRSGTRLGQGGGYYDRFLAQLRSAVPDVTAAAYLYDHELLPEGSLIATALDMPLTGVFTPSAFHRLGPASTAV
ncbi:5-formyltetrahydrofolate cyclo-ligase [Arthrobacter sp. CAN_A1]|uniref:5-formyltetrahydrofolate cyclo-ligase n=1 Tax=Arthrobacter sp. CAN_A1 TaxID=2787717 RepID=UPI0018CB2E55